MSGQGPWSEEIRLAEVGRSPLHRVLTADEAARRRIARELDLKSLDELRAELKVTPWLDGAEVEGRWRARIEQICGVTLDPFHTDLSGEFKVKVLPSGSRHAPQDDSEVVVDLEAEDPPDLLESDRIDLAAYVVEHLALEVDPFPRKPGAMFTPPEPEEPPSPFAVLQQLKTDPKAP